MLEPTGERMLPDQQRGELVHAEHVSRYKLASRYAAGKRVLDAACGEGYGSQLMLEAGAASVTGVDVDQSTIESAGQRYGADFVVGDVVDMPFEDDSFDMIVSFETIEHVEDADAALTEFRRVLAPNGLLIISTPNAAEYQVENEFHKREFSIGEFAQLLGDRFGGVHWLYQQNWLLSAVMSEPQLASDDARLPLDIDVYKAAGRTPAEALYLIAICGTELVGAPDLAYAADVYEANKLLEWVDRALDAEERAAEWQRRENEAARLLAQWQSRAEEAARLHSEWEKRATVAERLRDQYEEELTKVCSTLAWRTIGRAESRVRNRRES